jgi:hypothetical protein
LTMMRYWPASSERDSDDHNEPLASSFLAM